MAFLAFLVGQTKRRTRRRNKKIRQNEGKERTEVYMEMFLLQVSKIEQGELRGKREDENLQGSILKGGPAFHTEASGVRLWSSLESGGSANRGRQPCARTQALEKPRPMHANAGPRKEKDRGRERVNGDRKKRGEVRKASVPSRRFDRKKEVFFLLKEEDCGPRRG